jgi:hypothetical protein
MLDLNDARPQLPPAGELIPDGTFAKLKLTIRPGGADGAVALDKGLLKASQTSDARMLDCEFTVLEGPFARRKLWQNFTVAGGKLDEKGQSIGWNISKSSFRAMIDSALGLDPQDESQAAREKRMLQGLKHLDGITFIARIMVEPATSEQHKDANRIANIVLPGEAPYAPVMRGETVPPEPVNAKPRKAAAAPTAATPAWATPATPAPAAQAQMPWSTHPPSQAPAAAAPLTPPPPATAAGPAWLNG